VRGCPSAAPSHGDNGDNGGDDDHTAREKDAEFGGARKTYSVTSLDIETLGSPCNVVIRCREGRTPWECVVRAAVGDPVHLDIVLAKEGSAGAKFCFSSYMNQKFEMNMMDSSLVHDPAFTNIGLEVTEEELQRCTRFLTALDGRAAYSYFDAMVLVPLAPKVCPYHNATCHSQMDANILRAQNGRAHVCVDVSVQFVAPRFSDAHTSHHAHFSLQQVVCSFDNPGCASTSKRNRVLASMFDVMAEDLHSTSHPDKIKKVFCSQSVVLMLRHGLDPQGKHSALLESLNRVNSRLVSPRQVMLLLESFGAFPISNDQLSNM
jgi:hypothetical protein